MSPITRRRLSRAGPAVICRPKWNGRSPRAPASSTTPSASSGNGPAAPIPPTPAIAPSKARSASTTASSWSISWCCAVPRWRRLKATAVSPIATSSIHTTAGNSRDCGWPTTPDFSRTDQKRAGKRVQESIMNMHAPALADAHLPDEQTSAFARDAVGDLSQHPKRLSPKYFYDAAGSELVEAITKLPEYYPTRTELGILRDRGAEIASIIPDGAALVEFGAGATTKVRLLLERSAFAAYVPVDISGEFLNAQASGLRRDFPDLAVYPVAADFTTPFALPAQVARMPKVG